MHEARITNRISYYLEVTSLALSTYSPLGRAHTTRKQPSHQQFKMNTPQTSVLARWIYRQQPEAASFRIVDHPEIIAWRPSRIFPRSRVPRQAFLLLNITSRHPAVSDVGSAEAPAFAAPSVISNTLKTLIVGLSMPGSGLSLNF
jgi:hypothetical protein